jgi:hypothetical protein
MKDFLRATRPQTVMEYAIEHETLGQTDEQGIFLDGQWVPYSCIGREIRKVLKEAGADSRNIAGTLYRKINKGGGEQT